MHGGDGVRDAEGEMQQDGGDVEQRSAPGVPGQWDVCNTAMRRGPQRGCTGITVIWGLPGSGDAGTVKY